MTGRGEAEERRTTFPLVSEYTHVQDRSSVARGESIAGRGFMTGSCREALAMLSAYNNIIYYYKTIKFLNTL